MATVSKCDRCGKYVDRTEIPYIRGNIDPNRCNPGKDIRMDLCPECYWALREFLMLEDPDEEDK